MKIFEWLAKVLNGMERGIIDFISAFVPYAVPIIPAYLTFYHTQDMMDFPAWVAWTAAFVVEALGLASVATVVRFYLHNKRYKSEQNRAPFWIAFGVYVFYIVIVIVTNVILEIVADTRGGFIITAIGLFSLLSFPSGVLISIRTQYREMLDDKEEKKSQAKNSHTEQQPKEPKGKKPASHYQPQIVAMLEAEYEKNQRVLSPKEITAKLKLDHNNSKGYVSTATSKWMNEKGISKAPPNKLTF